MTDSVRLWAQAVLSEASVTKCDRVGQRGRLRGSARQERRLPDPLYPPYIRRAGLCLH